MFPVFWGDSTLRRYDYFQRNSDRTSWLKAVHSGWFDDTNPIATDHFSEALGGLKVFISPVESWGRLMNKETLELFGIFFSMARSRNEMARILIDEDHLGLKW